MFEDSYAIYNYSDNLNDNEKDFEFDDIDFDNIKAEDFEQVLFEFQRNFELEYPDLKNPSDLNSYIGSSNLFNFYNSETSRNNNQLIKLDIEDLLKQEGITEINGKPIKFGSREKRTSNIGSPNSWHKQIDKDTGYASARDISIVGGTTKDYEDFKNILLDNENIKDWMQLKNWGIINEVTPEILSQTKGTGNHFHFGPDTWARNTWNAWSNDPSVSVTKSFRNYKQSNKFASNKDFAITMISVYKKALQERGLDPNFAYMLTAQDAQESGWGKKPIGTYNYGNITTSKGSYKQHSDGNKYKNYNSLEEFVNAKIDTLLKDRYKFFTTFSPSSSVSTAMQVLANRGYAPGNTTYGKDVFGTYNTLIKYLNG